MTNCDGGNCLRSHVDLSETYNALVVITKAGVPSHKITVGISSYGRQFKMTDANCTHANCTYVGPKSTATPGRCTETPEYISNAEIKEIIRKNPSARVKDSGGNSKVLVFDGNWVSYMDDNDKIARTNLWKSSNFGGVIDWAIDLNTFDYDRGPGASGGQLRGSGMRGGQFHEKASTVDMCTKDDGWRSIPCTTKGIAKVNELEPSEIWDDVKAEAAWCAGLENWRSGNHGGKSFPSTLSKYFNFSPDFNCDTIIAGNGCNTPEECRASDKSSAPAMQVSAVVTARLHRAIY
jgi:hypothetical protein